MDQKRATSQLLVSCLLFAMIVFRDLQALNNGQSLSWVTIGCTAFMGLMVVVSLVIRARVRR